MLPAVLIRMVDVDAARPSEVGVTERDFDLIADDAMADFVVAFAPVDVSKDQIRSLLVEAA